MLAWGLEVSSISLDKEGWGEVRGDNTHCMGEVVPYAFRWLMFDNRHGWGPRVKHDVAHWHFFLRQHDLLRAQGLLEVPRRGRAGPSVWEGHLLHGSMHVYMPLDGQHWVGGMGEPLRWDMTFPFAHIFEATCSLKGLRAPRWVETGRGDAKCVGIEPLKARHDVTNLDLTILSLSLWCIEIDLSIQSMSLTSYMTKVMGKNPDLSIS